MMSQKLFLFVSILLIIVPQNIHCTVCQRCEWWKCPTMSSLFCPGDPVKDACSCCYECSLLEGEACSNDTPKCGKQLYCRKNEEQNIGYCRSKHDLINSLGLPSCYFKPGSFGDLDCRQVTTTFCSKDCKSCCSHRTSCNPNQIIYQEVDRCKLAQVSISGLPRKFKV